MFGHSLTTLGESLTPKGASYGIVLESLVAAGFEAGKKVGGFHFFAFRPIVIGMAFEATRLRAI